MATQTWYLRQIDGVATTNPNRLWWDAGAEIANTAQTTASSGWTVGKVAAGNYNALSQGLLRGTTTFGPDPLPVSTAPDNDATYTPVTGFTPPPLIVSTDAICTLYPYNGYFPAGDWTFNFPVIAVGSGGDQDGRIIIRFFKGTDAAFNYPQIYKIAYSPTLKLFVYVGGLGIIATSYNGNDWQQVYTSITTALYWVSWGNGIFMAVGDGGVIITSPDGFNWTSQTSGVSVTLYSVVYTGVNWVVTTSGGAIRTSSNNGVNWTARTSGVAFALYGIQYANGVVLAFGNNNGTLIKSTDDGVTWASKTFTTDVNVFMNSAAYGAFSSTPRWLVVGTVGWVIWSDDDGETWTSSDTGTNTHRDVLWDGTRFALCGEDGSNNSTIDTLQFTTSTTYTYTNRLLTLTPNNLYTIATNSSNIYVSGGGNSANFTAVLYVATSTTSTWTQQNKLTAISPFATNGTIVTDLTTTTAQTSTVTITTTEPVYLDNEYLFTSVAWEITGAGSTNTRDVLLRWGQGATMVSPEFVPRNYIVG